jgi:hypothetical protein
LSLELTSSRYSLSFPCFEGQQNAVSTLVVLLTLPELPTASFGGLPHGCLLNYLLLSTTVLL